MLIPVYINILLLLLDQDLYNFTTLLLLYLGTTVGLQLNLNKLQKQTFCNNGDSDWSGYFEIGPNKKGFIL